MCRRCVCVCVGGCEGEEAFSANIIVTFCAQHSLVLLLLLLLDSSCFCSQGSNSLFDACSSSCYKLRRPNIGIANMGRCKHRMLQTWGLFKRAVAVMQVSSSSCSYTQAISVCACDLCLERSAHTSTGTTVSPQRF